MGPLPGGHLRAFRGCPKCIERQRTRCHIVPNFLLAPQAEAEQLLREQEEKTARAAQRAEKLKRQLPAKGGSLALPAGVQPDTLEADMQVPAALQPIAMELAARNGTCEIGWIAATADAISAVTAVLIRCVEFGTLYTRAQRPVSG